jgi:hypothetical protein
MGKVCSLFGRKAGITQEMRLSLPIHFLYAVQIILQRIGIAKQKVALALVHGKVISLPIDE